MYRIKKGGAILSTEDGAVYVRLQENGVYITCPEHEAQGIVVNGGNIYALNGRGGLPGLEAVTVEEFSGAALIAEAHSELDGLIAAARQSLISPPSQGAPWNAEARYTVGDTVEGGYVALRYSRGKHGQFRRLLGDAAIQLSRVERHRGRHCDNRGYHSHP